MEGREKKEGRKKDEARKSEKEIKQKERWSPLAVIQITRYTYKNKIILIRGSSGKQHSEKQGRAAHSIT